MRTLPAVVALLLAGCMQGGCNVPYEADGHVEGIHAALHAVNVDGYARATVPAHGYAPDPGPLRINVVEKSIDAEGVQFGWVRWEWPSQVVLDRQPDKSFADLEDGVRRFLENITDAPDAQSAEWLRQMAAGRPDGQLVRHEVEVTDVDLAGLWTAVEPARVVDDVFAHWRVQVWPRPGASDAYHLRGSYPVTEVTWQAEGIMVLRADPRDLAQAEWRDYPAGLHAESGGTGAMRERATAHLEAGRQAMGLPPLGDLTAFSAGGHC